MRGLNHHYQGDLLSCSLQLLSGFERHQATETKAAKYIRPLWLQGLYLTQVCGRDFLQAFDS